VLAARDKTTGALVDEVPLPGRAIGAPMTYMVNGKQLIVLPIRGAQAEPPALLALALP